MGGAQQPCRAEKEDMFADLFDTSCNYADGCKEACAGDTRELARSIFTHIPVGIDDYEATAPIERGYVDFAAHKIVPEGWQLTPTPAPGVFAQLGRHDAVISNPDLGSRRRILFALPSWAVKKRRAEWLATALGQQAFHVPGLCPLETVDEVYVLNTVVLGWKHPLGQPLDQWVAAHGRLSEAQASRLCRELLVLFNELFTTPLRFSAFVTPSMVFVNKVGTLSNFVPLSSLLSWAGLQSTCCSLNSHGMSPEVERGITEGDGRVAIEKGVAISASTYEVAAVILEALTGVEPTPAWDGRISKPLSDGALDFFHRALYKDANWRLTVADALKHPWLATEKLQA
eukprot:TRINITY_DN124136_c0_g1_i1.p1 TRINITY_DN124136_c0_g1~~TRINITY_DN124136_c0_g1_i1.p1  ORF type:complete len:343 (-),score=66.20 TRINITY_DN124136_c0_g1_i1:239-1267(-)